MGAPSQRPLVAKLLAIQPMTIGGVAYSDVDSILDQMGVTLTVEDILEGFASQDIPISIPTLYRWKADVND